MKDWKQTAIGNCIYTQIITMIKRDLIFYWLRCTLLVPLTIGVVLLVSSVIGFILKYIVSEPSLEQYKHAINPLTSSFLSVILAHWIAPKYKSITTFVICSLWLLAVLLGLLITVTGIKLYGQEYEVKDGGIAIVMAVCGLAVGYYVVRKRKLNDRDSHGTLRIAYEDLETVGFDSGGGEMLNYKGKPFTGFIVQYDQLTGKLMCEEEFTDGHIGGAQRTFFSNGQIETEYFIKFNKYYGYNREWDEEGTLLSEYDWGAEP